MEFIEFTPLKQRPAFSMGGYWFASCERWNPAAMAAAPFRLTAATLGSWQT
jgi:hypothetical protein